MKPILKWAGGKRKLLPEIEKIIRRNNLENITLYEPFVGGGALFLDLELPNVCINDLNKELINVYEQIKNNPEELIALLQKHSKKHCHDYYYKVRNADRLSSFTKMSDVQKAARTIYLNRVCYNGLYRVNSKGQFNVPLGRYLNPEIVFAEKILELSKYLNEQNIRITNLDFEEAVQNAKQGDIVYFDPPYDYEKDGFTSYTSNGFSQDDLIRLKNVCDMLTSRGCFVVVSNNDTKFVNKLFGDKKYKIMHVDSRWTIGRDGNSRTMKREVIIYGK